MKNSYYIRKFREFWYFVLMSAILAGISTMIVSPGIMYADSYGRINFTYTVIDCVKKIFAGHSNAVTAKSWLTVTPSFFMAISRIFTGDIVLYNFGQALLFFLASLLLVRRLNTHYTVIQYSLFDICPFYYAVSVYYEAGIGCITGIAMLILFLSTTNKCITRFDVILNWIMIAVSSFVIFGYRANAFTIIPPLIAFILFAVKRKTVGKICLILSIVIGLVGTIVLPGIFHIDTMSSYSTGFVWEIFTTIQNMNIEKQEKYTDYLDEIGGSGSTEEALTLSSVSTVNSFLGYSRFDMLTLSEEDNGMIAVQKYIELWMEEPKACLQTKWEFVKKTLGIGEPINCWEYGYNIYDKMDELGFHDWKPREMFVDSYLGFHRCISILRYPWIIYVVTLLLVVWSRIKKDDRRQLYSYILAIAVFYYGAFILNTQSFELRYFYPSLYLMSIMDTAILMDLVAVLIKKL